MPRRKNSRQERAAAAIVAAIKPLDLSEEELAEIKSYDELQRKINAKDGIV